MEKDDEMKGVGNSYTTEFRELDPRLGRWLSRDPKATASPWSSPYVINGNNPIIMIDPKGDKEYESVDAYSKANKGKSWDKDRGQGDWLASDRKDNTDIWKNANAFNLQQEKGAQEYSSIGQRADFYDWFQDSNSKETKWAGAAGDVAHAIDMLTIEAGGLTDALGYSSEEARSFANTGNRMIFEDAFPKLRALSNGDILKAQEAQNWDMKMLSQEQNLIQPLYEKTGAFGLLSAAAKQKLAFSSWVAPVKPFNGDLMNVKERWAYGMKNMGYNLTPSQMPHPGATYTNGVMYLKFRKAGSGGTW